MENKKSLTLIDLFAGCGGISEGFLGAGYKVISAVEFDRSIGETLKKNHPETKVYIDDIINVQTRDLISNDDEIDIIAGGPPCQGFSISGDKNSSDPRNKLFESYVRIVDGLNPKCFVFENVKGIKTMFKGRYLKTVANSFSKIGYDIHVKVMNLSDYGLA